MTDDTEPPLEATELDHAYGDVRVLDDASLAVPTGAVTALIGPNGSGKTTLLRALVGLHEPDGGTISYRGPDAVRPIGYLPQRPAFRPGFTTRETISFYAELVGASDDPDALLDRVGLGEAAEERVETLSGGMTRLLGIAQATVGQPPVIVLDEPASGLDPGTSSHVFETVAELAASGTAVLLSSHELDLVERHTDRVALLDRGRIVQEGPPETLREQLGTDSLRGVYDATVAADPGTVRVRRGSE